MEGPPFGAALEREPVDAGRVEPMYGEPAIVSIAC
jgi:hypothetical protein